MESGQNDLSGYCRTALEEYSDLNEYLATLGGLVESRLTQLEPGPLTVKTGLIRLDDISLSTLSTDRALFESFSVPTGVHFVFLAPELPMLCRFCGKPLGADSFGIFQSGNSYTSVSGAGHRFVEVSLPLSYLPEAIAAHPRWQKMRAPEEAVFSVSQLGATQLRTALLGLFSLQEGLAVVQGNHSGKDALKEWLVASLVELLEKVLAIPAAQTKTAQRLRFDLFHSALEYIDADLGERLSTSLLAKRLKVSPRLLQYAFQHYARVTPGRYILHRRLQTIRSEIQHPSGSTMSLLEHALAYGLEHSGRFSQEYKRLFGELPSITMKRQIRS